MPIVAKSKVWSLPDDVSRVTCCFCCSVARYFFIHKGVVGELKAVCENHVEDI